MPDMLVSPSLLAADFLHLDSEIAMLSRAADWIHLDVMDGTFVPNISFGFSVLDAVAKVASKPMDVHLMTVHPERWFERLASLGASCVSFHLEENYDRAAESLYEIRSLGMKAGLAINPDIPVEKLYPYIGKADFFLIMSVFAGFGGQKFIPATLDRIAALRRELDKASDPALIEVDGGVGESNAALLHEAGAGVLVAGSSVFKSPDPEAAIRALRAA
ncbi:MAG: ribulose-phosphate 3-epimerase [Bacteroidales bacterium]|nr:ribulose-phosphate 3-epimerase [Bacteroidales bacterium]